MPEANGLHTEVTRLAISSGVSNRLRSEVADALKNSCSNCSNGCPLLNFETNSSTPAERWPRHHSINGHSRPGAGLREAAGDRELGRLGHAVVNHLDWNLDAALAADENNAPPIALFIPGK